MYVGQNCQFYDEGTHKVLFEMVAQHFSLYSLNVGVVIEKKNELRLNVQMNGFMFMLKAIISCKTKHQEGDYEAKSCIINTFKGNRA